MKQKVTKYFDQIIDFGGEIMPIGRAILELQKDGIPPRGIEMFLIGFNRQIEKQKSHAQGVAEGKKAAVLAPA